MTAQWTDPKPGALKIGAWIDTGFCSSMRINDIFIELFGPSTKDETHWFCISTDLNLRVGIEAPDRKTAQVRSVNLVLTETLRRANVLHSLIEDLRAVLEPGGHCFECGRYMEPHECGDEEPEVRICDQCAGLDDEGE